jgi:uncharacterized SAM-binding protein YcdF (DUF218 family)
MPGADAHSIARMAVRVTGSVALWWLFAWVLATVLITHAPLAHADAILVLSGSASLVERAQHAALLYRNRIAPTVLLTDDRLKGGWSVREQRNLFSVERALAELQANGVPRPAVVILSDVVSNTHDEALAVTRYADRGTLRTLLIVTSAYHSRRALWSLQRELGTRGVVVGVDPVAPGQQTPSPLTWWWTQRGWRDVVGEYVKLAWYLVRYR